MEQALRRELAEECGLTDVQLEGPIAVAESIAPPGLIPRKHVIHVIFHAVVADDRYVAISSADATIRGHRLVDTGEVPALPIHPPIHRFLERWRPGDPFVHLGNRWAR
jgi:ADP-ribose pyrophosphatase YjhB (NUDIX family)